MDRAGEQDEKLKKELDAREHHIFTKLAIIERNIINRIDLHTGVLEIEFSLLPTPPTVPL